MLFTGSAMALTKGEIMKCGGQLHACFQNNYNRLVDSNPISTFECHVACDGSWADISIDNRCSRDDCVTACSVTFDLDLSSSCN